MLQKFKLFDTVVVSGTASGYGDLNGIVYEENPTEIGGIFYYNVNSGAIYGRFLVAEHFLTPKKEDL